MWIGPDQVGVRGLALLGISLLAAGGLALHGLQESRLPSTALVGVSTSGARLPKVAQHNAAPTPSATAGQVKLGPKLSSSPYAQYAIAVYPGGSSQAARFALTGFDLHVSSIASDLRVSLVIVGSSHAPMVQNYLTGTKVYFIEANPGDDSSNSDFNFGDDGLIVTNAQGRVIE